VVPLSVLDLAPVVEGGDVRQALQRSLDLAQHAERWGYRRFWVAEHHGMPGVASAATAVVIAHIAGGTSSIRVGAGGIMLPNHAPLIIAEQFGTLAALFPDRIDLGLGRAPGTDPLTARALRRNLATDVDEFPRDVLELQALLGPGEPGQRVVAVPGEGSQVPLWILGSSLFGARLAAALGLPFAFASHFAPAQLEPAIEQYRARFEPSAQLARPHLMLAVNVFAADSEPAARLMLSSLEQAFLALRSGRPGKIPAPREGFGASLGPAERAMLDQLLTCTMVGTRERVQRELAAFAERHGADELIVACMAHDHAARLRSYEIAAQA
jgi:luciferase family oxidoreductase group 1